MTTLRDYVDQPQGIAAIHPLKRATKKVLMLDGSSYVFKAAADERKGFCVKPGTRYRREIVAYEVAKLLNISNVPETRIAKIEGKIGALQRFVIGSQEFKKLSLEARGELVHHIPAPQRVLLASYDLLMGNTDRHRSNYFITRANKVYLIDHGLSLHVKSHKGKTGRIVDASKGLIIPKEVKGWVAKWRNIRDIAASYEIEPRRINAMRTRLLCLWNAKTIGDAVKAIRKERP